MTYEQQAGDAIIAVAGAGVFIHPLADVEQGAVIGAGTKIWRFAHVRSGATIGKSSMVGNGCYIDTGVTIGDGVMDYDTYLKRLAQLPPDTPCYCEHMAEERDYALNFARLHHLAGKAGVHFQKRTARV